MRATGSTSKCSSSSRSGTTRSETTSETSSLASASRPKKSARSPRSNGRGPTYGLSSASATVGVAPAAAELRRELLRGPPVHAHAERAEVLLEVLPLGIARSQLDRDAQPPQALLAGHDEPAVEDAEVPVGEAVADEEQRRSGE